MNAVIFEPMMDYYQHTIKLLKKMRQTCPRHLALIQKILKDNDLLGSIVEEMIKADNEWNGNGSKYGYRKQRILWKICRIKKTEAKEGKRHNVQLTKFIKDKDDRIFDLDDRDMIERIKRIMETRLDDGFSNVIRMYYLEEIPVSEISERLDISRQTVHNRLKAGIKILKEILNG